MVIAGLQKMTLLDYPGKVACTVFLQGCNFRCPFCHNRGLLDAAPETIGRDELLAFLTKRQGLLDAVCISGGEPTLQPDLEALIREIKALGYAVKLDTNGSRPSVLKRLVAQGLLDYVAMDVKNAPARYGATVGTNAPALDAVEESLSFLLNGAVDYELRTTVVDELHSEQTFAELGQWLRDLSQNKAKHFFLQGYVDRDSVLCAGLHAPSAESLAAYKAILAPYVSEISIRGAS